MAKTGYSTTAGADKGIAAPLDPLAKRPETAAVTEPTPDEGATGSAATTATTSPTTPSIPPDDPSMLLKLLTLLRDVLFGPRDTAEAAEDTSPEQTVTPDQPETGVAEEQPMGESITLGFQSTQPDPAKADVGKTDPKFAETKDDKGSDSTTDDKDKTIDLSTVGAPDRGYPRSDADGLGFDPDADPEDNRDFIQGGQGDDDIRAGDDRDTVLAGAGADSVDGGFDDDEIDGGADDDRLVGGEGADTILGGSGDDVIFAGNDPARVPDGFNIEDVAGPDTSDFAPDRDPENGRDFVDGGSGDDEIYGADDSDTLLGGSGDDTIDGEIDDDLIFGGAGDDVLRGGQGDDTVFGGAGRDVFTDVTAGDVLDGGSGAEDFDTLDLRGSAAPDGALSVTYTSDSREDGFVQYFNSDGDETGQLTFTEMESVISCFVTGTRIATPMGERKIEDLKVGERVITRDNGLQIIRWTGARQVKPRDFQAHPEYQPIHIPKGALGHGAPLRSLTVSPNHRLLITGNRAALYFEENEVLVAAKHLVGFRGIRQLQEQELTYHHIMCDRHEVILSEGAWTESFQPGDMSLGGVDAAQRDELFSLFPALATRQGLQDYAAARRSLKKHEAKLILEDV